MKHIDFERIYFTTNWIAFFLGMIGFGAAAVSDNVSLWIPFLILITPTSIFIVVSVVALVWSFILTRETNEFRSNR